WLIWAFVGFRKTVEIWPAILVAGVSFAVPQFLVSNYHGPWLVDVVASICSMGALTLFRKICHPKEIWTSTTREAAPPKPALGSVGAMAVGHNYSRSLVIKAWTPWAILTVLVFMWGLPQVT